jgi:TP901 family phage tail tape measure protein/lambda family phage tail tape measure protein
MAANLDAVLRIKSEALGTPSLQALSKSVADLGRASQVSGADLGRMNIAINRVSRDTGNTIAGIRAHADALTKLRERTEIGGRAYIRLGNEIDSVRAKLERLTTVEKQASRADWKRVVGAGAGSLAMGGGIQGAIGGAAGAAAIGGPAAMALTAGALAAAAGVTGATSAALDEEASIRRVRTLSNDAEGLMQRIRELSTEQGHLTNNTEAGAAAYEILSSGFGKTSDVIEILKASTLGAAGGFTDIKTVADAATSIMNAFGLGAEKVTEIVDQMIQTQNDGKIVVGQYAQSIGRLAPTFAVAGLSIEEMNAAISSLTAKGTPVETTISGLNQAVKSIIKPTDEAKKAAAALGIEFSAAALESKGLGGFLQDVIVKTKGNSAALGVLFSDIDGFRAVTALTNDQLKGYNKSLENMDALTGQAAKSAKLAVDPVKQFDNAWKDFSSTLGRMVLPALATTVKALTSIIDLAGKIDLTKVRNPNASLMGGDIDLMMGGGKTPGAAPALRPYTVAGITYDPITGRPIAGVGGRNARLKGGKKPNDSAITALIEGLDDKKGKEEAKVTIITGGFTGGDQSGPSRGRSSGPHLHAQRVSGAGVNEMVAAALEFPGGRTALDPIYGERRRPGYHDGYRGNDYGTPQGTPFKLRPGWVGSDMGVLGALGRGMRVSGPGGVFELGHLAGISTGQVGKSQLQRGGGIDGQMAWKDSIADANAKAKQIEEERKKKEKEAAEQTAKQLIAAGRLLTTSEAALRVAEATNPLERLSAEYGQDRARRMADYADRLQGARSEEERMALVAAQTRDIRAAEIGHQEKLKELTAQRITQELEGADALAESMARLQEFTTRSSTSAGFKQGIQSYVDSIGNMRDAVGQLTVNSIGGLEDSLTELANTGTVNFRAFAASVLQDTSRMIIRQVVLGTIMQAIGGILTPSTAGLGIGSPRSMGSYAGGGYTGNGPRSGGLDGQGGFIAMLHPKETIIDHTRGAPMTAASGSTNITINVDATGTKAAGDQGRSGELARDLARVVDDRLIYQKRPGGLLAP